MKFHMAFLDATCRQGAQRGKILCQSNGGHHRRQLFCGTDCGDREPKSSGRVQFQGSANNTGLQRYFDLAEQIALRIS